MKRRQILGFLGIAVAGLLLAIGLPLVTPSPVIAQSNTSIVVSAASSLRDALQDIKILYQQSKSNINISYNFGASGALQQQIEQGAPADIFISAATKQVDALETKGLLLSGSRTNLANNRLVLIVAQDVVGITSFNNLTDSKIKKIAIGEPRSVPAGQYAEEVLNNLKLYDQVKSKFVLGNNVRQVLAAVESGNAQAGIVYATDAKTSNKVKVVITAEEKLHSPIVYPVAIIKGSKNISAAKQFVQFLSGSQAKTVLRKYGFIVR
ncbi:molybdate ABC transporter substrate-binding protein [Nostoc favosum]|uniref:Molybdate ABC transporter substrate-binding protein n=1 Tax=Nostoc favosum CHAB5714 TaxID=2780399 RepID=A0ABS8IEV8_9NOSO|nr:molybdate ABC transporter substrate-binding protein [Nostoc favosum]MCC5602595.1 molybdate ABC transporter substrate-binding protein [Nostoc favosum CHAB5714]